MSLDTCKSQFIALKRDSEQQVREGLRTCLDCNVCKAETFPPFKGKWERAIYRVTAMCPEE